MEPKKNSNADLTNYRSLIFGISFLLSLTLVITAFEWKGYDDGTSVIAGRAIDVMEDPIIPRTEILPPQPPVKPMPILVVVSNDDEITKEVPIDISFGNDPLPLLELPEPPALEVEKYDEPVLIAEVPASPYGGFAAFYRDLTKRMKYPAQARRMQVEGKVFVEFVINRDGTITEIKVLKGIGGGCDEEAVRVLETSPRWTPGKQRGVPVRQRMVLPITFKLS